MSALTNDRLMFIRKGRKPITYTKPGTIEITYSDGITQRFTLERPAKNASKDILIVHHKHTARYIK